MKINKLLLDPDQQNGLTGGAPGMPAIQTSALPPAGTQISHPEPAANPNPESPNDTPPANPVSQPPVTGDEDGVKMSDFEAIIGKGFSNEPASKPDATEKPTQKADDKSQQDDKTNAEPAKAPEGLPPISLTATPPKKPSQMSQRDFTDIPAEDQDLFRKMSQDAFDKLKPVYIEHKKLAATIKAKDDEITQLKTAAPTGLPPSYLEHEQAFTLTPEYQEAVGNTEQLRLEYGHWAAQLDKVKAGEEWQGLALDAKGNLIKTAPAKPSPAVEEFLRGKMLEAQTLYRQTEQQIGYLAQTHKQKVQQGYQMLKQAEDTYFPFYKTLPADSPHKKIIDQAVAALPEPFRNSPMAILLGKAYATCVHLMNQNKELSEGKIVNTQAAIQEDVKKAGPTQGKLGAAPSATPQGEQDVMAGFERIIGKKIG